MPAYALPLFFITLGVYLVATAATALSWNFWSFVVFRFITGAGSYTADRNLPNQVFAYFIRSDRPHAEIVSIDAGNAQAFTR